MSSSAWHCTWQNSGRCRVLLDILQSTTVEFISKFYMVQQWTLTCSARHSTWYKIGRCRVRLNTIICTKDATVEFISTFYLTQDWGSRFLPDILNGTKVGVAEICSKLTWQKTPSLRVLIDIYIFKSGRCRVLLDNLQGTVEGVSISAGHSTGYNSPDVHDIQIRITVASVGFFSTFYIVKKWALPNFARHSK